MCILFFCFNECFLKQHEVSLRKTSQCLEREAWTFCWLRIKQLRSNISPFPAFEDAVFFKTEILFCCSWKALLWLRSKIHTPSPFFSSSSFFSSPNSKCWEKTTNVCVILYNFQKPCFIYIWSSLYPFEEYLVIQMYNLRCCLCSEKICRPGWDEK